MIDGFNIIKSLNKEFLIRKKKCFVYVMITGHNKPLLKKNSFQQLYTLLSENVNDYRKIGKKMIPLRK